MTGWTRLRPISWSTVRSGARQVDAGVHRQDHLRADVADHSTVATKLAVVEGGLGQEAGLAALTEQSERGGSAADVSARAGGWMAETIIEIIISEGRRGCGFSEVGF